MKIGRPKKFDEDIALQAAMMYFWQNGYDNPKPIFTHFYSPNVYYIPNKNILRVNIFFL